MSPEIVTLQGHTRPVISAAFSPDGQRVVTASDDGTARLWDAGSGQEQAVLRGHEGYVLSAGFSPDGQRVVTASYDHTARLWDAGSGPEITVLQEDHSRHVFSPDGRRTTMWPASTAFTPDRQRVIILHGKPGLTQEGL